MSFLITGACHDDTPFICRIQIEGGKVIKEILKEFPELREKGIDKFCGLTSLGDSIVVAARRAVIKLGAEFDILSAVESDWLLDVHDITMAADRIFIANTGYSNIVSVRKDFLCQETKKFEFIGRDDLEVVLGAPFPEVPLNVNQIGRFWSRKAFNKNYYHFNSLEIDKVHNRLVCNEIDRGLTSVGLDDGIFAEIPNLRPSRTHDIQLRESGVITRLSVSCDLVHTSSNMEEVFVPLYVPMFPRKILNRLLSREFWFRGLAQIEDDKFLVGASEAYSAKTRFKLWSTCLFILREKNSSLHIVDVWNLSKLLDVRIKSIYGIINE